MEVGLSGRTMEKGHRPWCKPTLNQSFLVLSWGIPGYISAPNLDYIYRKKLVQMTIKPWKSSMLKYLNPQEKFSGL